MPSNRGVVYLEPEKVDISEYRPFYLLKFSRNAIEHEIIQLPCEPVVESALANSSRQDCFILSALRILCAGSAERPGASRQVV
jgi:hypothetical protein